jgi:hypothetical protein
MHGIGVGIEQADRDGAIAARLQRRDQLGPHPGFVERPLDRTVGAQALGRLEAILAPHRRRRLGIEQVVDVAPVVTLHEQQVAKTRGSNEGDCCALALQHGVGRHRRAVAEILYARQVDARGGQRRERADIRAFGRARHLGDDDPAAVHRYQVGEGAADLNAHAHSNASSCTMLRCGWHTS